MVGYHSHSPGKASGFHTPLFARFAFLLLFVLRAVVLTKGVPGHGGVGCWHEGLCVEEVGEICDLARVLPGCLQTGDKGPLGVQLERLQAGPS